MNVIYEGQMVENKYHGIGRLTIDGMMLQEGEFKNGKMHGKGRVIMHNGIMQKVVAGQFLNGVYQQ